MSNLSDLLAGGNYGPQFRQKVSLADDQIEYLRKFGQREQADLLQSQIAKKIQNRDESIAQNFGALGQLYSISLKSDKPTGKAEEQEVIPDLPVIADRIQDALRIGEDSNIRVSPVLIQNAFEAEMRGDPAEAFRAAKSIEKEIDDQRKQQVEEDKTLQTLADGTQVLFGKRTGTRYSASGIPLSQGPINTGIYNKVVEEFTGVPQQLAQPTGTIERSPQVYAQPVQQAPTRLQETIRILEEANQLAQQGDKAGAAARLNAVRSQGIFGMPITEETVSSILGSPEEEEVTPTPSESPTDSKKGKTQKGTTFKVLD
jgi:hypothetical protein